MNAKDLWAKLRAQLQGIEAAMDQLGSASTLRQISAAESMLGIKFPEDFRSAYMEHNGTDGPCFIFGPYRLWSLSYIVEENIRNRADNESATTFRSDDDKGQIRGCVHSQGWITFGDDGGHSQLAIDLDPGVAGRTGQIIELVEDGTNYVADSLFSFFSMIVTDIENGALEWNELGRHFEATISAE